MSGANSFGSRFVLTTFGESHGVALGAVIDGMPAGVAWSDQALQSALDRRKPGQSDIVSARGELDKFELLSGVFEGKTLGTPIAVIVRNQDTRPEDYAAIKDLPRRGHADDVWQLKFGHRDHRGGGRASGRETLSRVIGGACAEMLFKHLAPKLLVRAFAASIGPLALDSADRDLVASDPSRELIDSFAARFPSRRLEAEVLKLLHSAKQEGRSHGGVAEIWVDGVPAGLGQPVFRKLKADLAHAFLGIGATAGVEMGEGFGAASAEGSDFHSSDSKVYGGVRGGVSTGERIAMRVAFKPTATVLDVAKKGRHDPCIIPRAIPVLEAMASLVIADHLLWRRTDQVTWPT